MPEFETTATEREGWLDELSLHLRPPRTTMPLEFAKAVCRDLDKAIAAWEAAAHAALLRQRVIEQYRLNSDLPDGGGAS